MISVTEVTSPTATPTSAPVVLNRRHTTESRSAGKFALAATEKARPTRNWTLNSSPASSASTMATAPIPAAAIRATAISARSSSRPRCTTPFQKSCATAPEAEITSPATTASRVANATAETTAKKMSPPVLPAPPPSNSAV
jgi:hypothetical protein